MTLTALAQEARATLTALAQVSILWRRLTCDAFLVHIDT